MCILKPLKHCDEGVASCKTCAQQTSDAAIDHRFEPVASPHARELSRVAE
jgi:hypothetical protein